VTRAEIVKKYTRVVRMGTRWNTYLQVDNQGFCVCDQLSKRDAEWYAKMLSIAIEAIILDETGGTK
jgi:hypothetical protein